MTCKNAVSLSQGDTSKGAPGILSLSTISQKVYRHLISKKASTPDKSQQKWFPEDWFIETLNVNGKLCT